MPGARKKLPRNARRLPKGTNRWDYEPEVFEEWQRDRWRQRKADQHKRERHRGLVRRTYSLSKEALANLTRMAKELDTTQSKLLTTILEQFNEPVQPVQKE